MPNDDDLAAATKGERPKIVCLCGSTRFLAAFQAANLHETLAGHIVLSVGSHTQDDATLFGSLPVDEVADLKARLDRLHLHKMVEPLPEGAPSEDRCSSGS